MKSVAVVIVNYRVSGLTIDCLESIAAEMAAIPGGRAYVVENASNDGSAEAIAGAIESRGWSGWTEFIASPVNGGFAAGNNIALRKIMSITGPSRPEHILLLNPDTVVRAGAIRPLVEFLDSHPRVGTVGSRLEDPDQTPQASFFRFPTPLIELDRNLRSGLLTRPLGRWIGYYPMTDTARRVDWLAGAAMMVKRELLADIGLFDEGYFLYCEETDLCLRAHRRGWECWYVPDSHVVHLVGRSSGVTIRDQRPERRPQYWFDSRRRYLLKNHGSLYAFAADILAIIGFALWRGRRVLTRKPDRDPPRLLFDLIRNSVFVRGTRI